MRTRALTAFAAVAVVLGACGGSVPEQAEVPAPELDQTLALPPVVDATPAFAVKLAAPATDRRIKRARNKPGVALIVPVRVGRVRAALGHRRARLRVAAADPMQLRPLTPVVTRDADFVWTSLLLGNAVLGFDAARRLDTSGTGRLDLGAMELGIGALAETGAPAPDVLVNEHTGVQLDLPDPALLLVAARPKADLEPIRRSLRKLFPGARVRALSVPDEPGAGEAPPPPPAAGGTAVGAMSFRILEDGFIEPDPGWVEANIASGTVPILGGVTCHRIMFRQLYEALAEIQRAGLAGLIDPSQYGGCYVPRFIDRDPGKALSMHAFGLAVDINVSENGLGTRGNLDPRIVEIFEKWGFEWGGWWSRPDPMHFELDRLLSA
ncbi:MAG: M15 family metallopeptidase [Actinomycetota bacterium]